MSPKENLCMFIRNTPEQRELYKPLRDRVRLILLPDWVQDIGSTRKAIVLWGAKHSPDLIFMLDDRVNGLWWLNTVSRPGGVFLDADKRSSPKTAFQIWAYQTLSNSMAATSISNKGFHWMPNRVNSPIKPLNGGVLSVCIALCPGRLLEQGVNYGPIFDTGIEDTYIVHRILTEKLPFCNLSDIAFSQVKTNNVGGNASVQPDLTRADRLLVVKRLFWEKTLGIPWGTKHPGYYLVSTKVEPQQIRINYQYWRKYYGYTE